MFIVFRIYFALTQKPTLTKMFYQNLEKAGLNPENGSLLEKIPYS